MAQVPSANWKQPADKARPLLNVEVAPEERLMELPVMEIPADEESPPPARESPEELKVEVAEPVMFRRSVSSLPAMSRWPAMEEVALPETIANLFASRFEAISRFPALVEVPAPVAKNWSASMSPAESRFPAKVEVPDPWMSRRPVEVTLPVAVETVKTELVAAFNIWKAAAEFAVV
jgi:hypothetical protein